MKKLFSNILFLTFFFCVFINAQNENLHENFQKRYSFDLSNLSVETVIRKLEEKSGISISYNVSKIDVKKIISLKIINKKLNEILHKLKNLTDTEIKFVDKSRVLLLPKKKLQKTGKLSGIIVSSDISTPLIGANIIVKEISQGVSTDSNGKFNIENIPVGTYTLNISYIGYRNFSKTDIIIRSNRTSYVNITLSPQAYKSDEVIVTSSYFTQIENHPVSTTNFSFEEIRRTATVGSDLSRMINTLPSVANQNDANHIIARGGSTIENSFYIDNIKVPNINHFPIPGSTGGLFTLVNLDFVDNLTLMTGGFSSKYGNALSSVMNIKLREGNKNNTDMQFDLNFGGISAQIEGPLWNDKISYMFSVRHSFTDIILKLIGDDQNPYVFDDLQGKIVYDISQNDKLSFLTFLSWDSWDLKKEDSINDSRNWYGDIKLNEQIVGLNWKHLWKNGYSETSISFNSIKTKFSLIKILSDEIENSINSRESQFNFRNINHFSFNSKLKTEFGTDLSFNFPDIKNYFSSNLNSLGRYTEGSNFITSENSFDVGIFSTLEWQPSSSISFYSGIRYDYFDFNNSNNFSGNFSLKYNIDDFNSISLSASRNKQSLPVYFFSQNKATQKLKTPTSNQFVLGYESLLSDDIKFTVELYDKEYFNMPEDSLQNELYLLDEAMYQTFFKKHNYLTSNGRSKTYGAEVSLQKKYSSRFYGIFSASYMRSFYKNPSGNWIKRFTDYKFLFALELGYKPNSEWEFNIRWNYAGGTPYTPFNYELSERYDHPIFDTSKMMSENLPAYNIVNIRADKRFHFDNSTLIVYLSVWNLLDEKLVSYHDYSTNEKSTGDYTSFGRLPVFGIEFEF